MTDPRRRRARELFDQALDLPPEERDAFLTAACEDDRDLIEVMQISAASIFRIALFGAKRIDKRMNLIF